MILLGFGLGLLAGTLIGGYWIARRIYTRQLGPNNYVTVQELIDALHIDRDDPSYCNLCGGRCEVDP